MHVFCISYYVDICKLITTKKKKSRGFCVKPVKINLLDFLNYFQIEVSIRPEYVYDQYMTKVLTSR